MDKKKLILLVGALIIAVGSAFIVNNILRGSAAPEVSAAVVPDDMGPKVLVASRSLPVGTIITPDAFSFQPWPKDLIEDAYYISGQTDQAALVGTVVRNAITAGQPLTQGSVVHPGDRGFLAAALAPGMRAVTFKISKEAGQGFVFPGDRIDLVLTQKISGDDGPALNASETIVRNLRVLATDRRVSGETLEGQSVVQEFSTVTVEATPRIAERITVAQEVGALSLTLRSLADTGAELERAIASGEVEVPNSNDPEAEAKFLKEAMSRPIDNDRTFSTGGDVSRFQRRTIPRSGTKSAPAAAPTYAPAGSVEVGQTVAAPQKSNQPSVTVTRGKSVTVVSVGEK